MKGKFLCRDKEFYASLLKLATPLCLQNLLTFLLSVSDNVMIGRLGESESAGVFVGTQVQLLLQMLIAGVEGGMLIVATQYHGRGDGEGVRRVAALGVRISTCIGTLLFLISFFFSDTVSAIFSKNAEIIDTGSKYLAIMSASFIPFSISGSLVAAARSVEKAKVGFYSSAAALATNVFLNYVLIYGKLGFRPYGVMGAAISTVVARCVEALTVGIYVLGREKTLALRIKNIFRLDREARQGFIKHGLPIFFGQAVWAFNTLAATAIMGLQSGEGVTAALAIATTLNNLSYVITNGTATALGILVGKAVGEGERDKIREYSRTGQMIFIILGLGSAMFLLIARTPFTALFSVGDAAKLTAGELLWVLIFIAPFTAYQLGTLTGLVKGGGDSTFVLRADLVLVFLVILPLALVFTRLSLPPFAVLLALKADHVIKCVLAFIKVKGGNFVRKTTEA